MHDGAASGAGLIGCRTSVAAAEPVAALGAGSVGLILAEGKWRERERERGGRERESAEGPLVEARIVEPRIEATRRRIEAQTRIATALAAACPSLQSRM